MREGIHPTWYPNAKVTCACGHTWTVGSTKPTLNTDVCSNCHPFYTGEQRIVDTEGQVERFLKRLETRDARVAEDKARRESRTSPGASVTELGLAPRAQSALQKAGVNTIGDFLSRLAQSGDEGVLSIEGFG